MTQFKVSYLLLLTKSLQSRKNSKMGEKVIDLLEIQLYRVRSCHNFIGSCYYELDDIDPN